MASEKLIRASDLISRMREEDKDCPGVPWSTTAVEELLYGIPGVDAIIPVRCKECKHYDNTEGIQWCHLNSKFHSGGTDWHSFPEDGFCSYGERRCNE